MIIDILTILTSRVILGDTARLLAATALFAVILVPPGYLAAYFVNLFDFRVKRETYRVQIAVLGSIGVTPILTFLAARSGTMLAADLFMAFCLAAYIGLAARRIARPGELVSYVTVRKNLPVLIAVLLLVLAVAAMVVDIEVHGRLIRNLMNHDYVKHVAVTDAISRTGLPPANPNLYPGGPLGLFYYYFWFLLCSFADRYGGGIIDARAAVHGSIVWCGLALVALVNVFLRERGGVAMKGVTIAQRRWAFALLLVTGLDIIPVTIIGLRRGFPMSIEWWNEQVTAWAGAVLWVPHHVGAFLAAMTAFLILSEAAREQGRRRRLALHCGVALCMASALGMSIWVGVTAAAILAAWCVVALWQRRYGEARALVTIGLLSMVLSLPFLLDLQLSNGLRQAPVKLYVRTFGPTHRVLSASGTYGIVPLWLADLASLPLNYLIELGIFLLGTLYYALYRRRHGGKLGRDEWFMVTMASTSVLLCTIVSANVVNNDLGARGFMFAQFAMLLWSVVLIANLFGKSRPVGRAWRALAVTMIVLGVGGNVYDMVSMRFRFLGPHGRPSLAFRTTYEWVRRNLPRDAVVQPYPRTDIEYFLSQYGNRQAACSDWLYGQLYGVPPEVFRKTHDRIAPIFERAMEPAEVVVRCAGLQIDYLVFTVNEPVWEDSSAWIWRRTPVYDSGLTRIFAVDSLR